VKALDNLSFNVGKGEIVGFIGPNGSGKTTTIKLLTGILSPNSGNIEVCGYNLKNDALKAKMCIGYISDNPDMFLRLKGIDFLNFIADIYKVPTDIRKDQIAKLAGVFELTENLGSPMLSYSHGMRQKTMVIAALIHNPAVWILDEPLTGLDPKSAYELKKMMRAHAKKGNCVFFSTHVLEVAEKLCDRIAIIKGGKLVECGRTQDIVGKSDLESVFLELAQEGEQNA
ncbi:MAG: ABC transporter ATP-binding protein, partial [Oscillospiraceae bacterium]